MLRPLDFKQNFLFLLDFFLIFIHIVLIILAMAEEMGISMDRFDVVRRAMALAAHGSDNTPALAGLSNYYLF